MNFVQNVQWLSIRDKLYYDGKQPRSRETFYILGSCILYWEIFLGKSKKLAGQAQKAVFSLMKLLNKFDVTHDVYCNLFDNMIMPILCFGSEVW